MIVKDPYPAPEDESPYPVLIKGIPHKLHERFGFPMWQLAEGGEYTRCNKDIETLELAVEARNKKSKWRSKYE